MEKEDEEDKEKKNNKGDKGNKDDNRLKIRLHYGAGAPPRMVVPMKRAELDKRYEALLHETFALRSKQPQRRRHSGDTCSITRTSPGAAQQMSAQQTDINATVIAMGMSTGRGSDLLRLCELAHTLVQLHEDWTQINILCVAQHACEDKTLTIERKQIFLCDVHYDFRMKCNPDTVTQDRPRTRHTDDTLVAKLVQLKAPVRYIFLDYFWLQRGYYTSQGDTGYGTSHVHNMLTLSKHFNTKGETCTLFLPVGRSSTHPREPELYKILYENINYMRDDLQNVVRQGGTVRLIPWTLETCMWEHPLVCASQNLKTKIEKGEEICVHPTLRDGRRPIMEFNKKSNAFMAYVVGATVHGGANDFYEIRAPITGFDLQWKDAGFLCVQFSPHELQSTSPQPQPLQTQRREPELQPDVVDISADSERAGMMRPLLRILCTKSIA